MPRIRKDDIRRRELIEATISCIHKYGYHEATVSRICAKIGISSGNIHHYFGGKGGLLEATMKALLGEIKNTMVERLRGKTDPGERIDAIISSNFSPHLFRPEICRVWLHFWAQAPHTPELGRLEHINATRFRRNLLHELKRLVPVERSYLLAKQIVAMVDGLWVQRAQADGGMEPGPACDLVTTFLERQITSANKERGPT